MDGLGPNVEDPGAAIAGLASRLLRNPSKGSALVKQPQLTIGMLMVGRIEVAAAIYEASMEVRNQRSAISQRVRSVSRRIIAGHVVDESLNVGLPLMITAQVRAVVVAVLRTGETLLRQQVLAE